jgi:hypothetical protein
MKAAMEGQQEVLRDFRRIPGVGPRIARDLWDLGLRGVEELKGQDPERLYEALCDFQGQRVDRCMLYVFRCAVYFASHDVHVPDLLLWWNWKDAPDRVLRSTPESLPR